MSYKQTAIIIDIDGTAALGIGDHRKAYDYHLCGNDKPNLPVWCIIEALSTLDLRLFSSADMKFIFLSGRENVSFPGKSERKDKCYRRAMYMDNEYDNCYSLTYAWLKYHLACSGIMNKETNNRWDLFMRPADVYNRDDEIKYQIYQDFIKNKYRVLFVLDDRNQVVDMWRDIGLTCLQVADGNF
tara:strand:- start:1849 stop:2403 length:555 start_codon:yes stop_codon:yes gene_type:complete